MKRVLILKTGALGDVLRTTVVLPGLKQRFPDCEVVWITAAAAHDLVAHHPAVGRVETVEPGRSETVDALADRLAAEAWDWVLSFEEDEASCRLASRMQTSRLSGAWLDEHGGRVYSDDVAPWFGMGLLAREGRAVADRRKRYNRRTHPEIFTSMLGLPPGRPELPLDAARCRAARSRLGEPGVRPWIGLNTGSGSRWPTKSLDEARVVALVDQLHAAFAGRVGFVLLGGADECDRNARIAVAVGELEARPRMVDAGCRNGLLDFAAVIDACDLLITSDSLGMHIAIARQVRTVAFFAPTSAAEIDLFGLGEKVASTAPDYCSYRRDADNSTITVERLVSAVQAAWQGDGAGAP